MSEARGSNPRDAGEMQARLAALAAPGLGRNPVEPVGDEGEDGGFWQPGHVADAHAGVLHMGGKDREILRVLGQ